MFTYAKMAQLRYLMSFLLIFLLIANSHTTLLPGITPTGVSGIKVLGNGPIDFAVTQVTYFQVNITQILREIWPLSVNGVAFKFQIKYIIVNNYNQTVRYEVPNALPPFYLNVETIINDNVSSAVSIPQQHKYEFVGETFFFKPGITNGTLLFPEYAFLLINDSDSNSLPDGKYVFTMVGPNDKKNGKAYSAILTSQNGTVTTYYEYNSTVLQRNTDFPNDNSNSLMKAGDLLLSTLVAIQSMLFVTVPVAIIIVYSSKYALTKKKKLPK